MSLTTVLLSGSAGGLITWLGGLAVKQKGWPAIKAWLEARAKRLAAKAEAKLESQALKYESAFRSALVAELAPVMTRLRTVEEKAGIAPGAPAPAAAPAPPDQHDQAQHQEGGQA
jgi:hypothetical protein